MISQELTSSLKYEILEENFAQIAIAHKQILAIFQHVTFCLNHPIDLGEESCYEYFQLPMTSHRIKFANTKVMKICI